MGANSYWILDPLDGTGNFAKGSKNFAFSLARARWDEESQLYKRSYCNIWRSRHHRSTEAKLQISVQMTV